MRLPPTRAYNRLKTMHPWISNLEGTGTVKQLRRPLLALTCLAGIAVTAGAGADTKLDIANWKEILPEPVYAKVVEESAGKLTGYTASASQFAQNGRRAQAEATNLIIYAEIAHRAGNANAAALRDDAVKLLEAAKARKADVAKELAAKLVNYKSLSSSGKSGDSDLAKTTSMKTIMDVTVKGLNPKITQYKRITAAALGGKSDEVARDLYKLAALSVAVSAHAPTTDLPKGKTAKDWLSASEEMRTYALQAATAAKNKKASAVTAAVKKMDAACTRCHEDFRIETD